MADSLLENEDQFDENKDYLSELVGEGKKFKTQADLAKGKAFADRHIAILERQQDALRKDYEELRQDAMARAKLEDLVTQLQSNQVTKKPTVNDTQNQPSFDPTQVESLIDSRIQERERSQRETDNFNMVRSKLTERYGDNYQPTLNKQIAELGLSNIDDMARKTPKVLIRALGLDQPVQDNSFQAPPGSGQRFTPSGQKDRTWSWYQELKKSDPTSYFSPKMTKQMEDDYRRLEAKFEDGDFHDNRFEAMTYNVR